MMAVPRAGKKDIPWAAQWAGSMVVMMVDSLAVQRE